jgi:hypothetical protein
VLKHSPDRHAQPMPLACKTDEKGNRYWVGSDVILGDIIDDADFELRSETICRRLVHSNGTITHAEVEHLPTATKEMIAAKIVITACDALRTPQLLWNSGIRLKALGTLSE